MKGIGVLIVLCCVLAGGFADDAAREEMYSKLHEMRETFYAPSLTVSPVLQEVAQQISDEFAVLGEIAQLTPDRVDFVKLLLKDYYEYETEYVAINQVSEESQVSEAFAAMMDDYDARSSLFDRNMAEVGVGLVKEKGEWTVVLAVPAKKATQE
ncbi:hypothetical protein QOT17_005584 [Balamuthia mandrillaris]